METMEKIIVNGRPICARELTALEVQKALESKNIAEDHTFDLMFPDEPVSALGMAMSLDIEPNELFDLTPSQLAILIEEVKKKNPFWVMIMENLVELCRRIISEKIETRNEEPVIPSKATIKRFH